GAADPDRVRRLAGRRQPHPHGVARLPGRFRPGPAARAPCHVAGHRPSALAATHAHPCASRISGRMLLSPLLIGGLSGLRTSTPPAVVAWSAQLGVLRLDGALALIGSTPAVAALTVLALVELASDKWPKLPNRTTAPGLA